MYIIPNVVNICGIITQVLHSNTSYREKGIPKHIIPGRTNVWFSYRIPFAEYVWPMLSH